MTKYKGAKKYTNKGHFVISLDFELYWGVFDVFNKEKYGGNILGARKAIPEILKLFESYHIEATWAIVGMLNFNNVKELKHLQPKEQPHYTNTALSAYKHFCEEGIIDNENSYYFAPELIQLIRDTPRQEIGSHTFSHYYCLERGQTTQNFMTDAQAFSEVMEPITNRIRSIVFPRNQVNKQYLYVCKELGLDAYRGNEQGWIYQMKGNDRKNFLKRALRLLDMYFNLFGPQTYTMTNNRNDMPLNIRGSRQLKPVAAKWSFMEKKRLKRILDSMTYAARNQEIYHLWWHPHNFGVQIDSNMKFLKKILEHYQMLNHEYGFESASMGRLAGEIISTPRL